MSSVNPYAGRRFVPIFDDLLNVEGITLRDAHVYGMLARFRGTKPNGAVYASQRTLSEALGGISPREVRRHLRRLVKASLITVHVRAGRSNLYTFNQRPMVNPTADVDPPCTEPPAVQSPPGAQHADSGIDPPDLAGGAAPADKIPDHTSYRQDDHSAVVSGEPAADQAVVAHWASTMGKRMSAQAQLKYRKLLRARRAEGFTDDDLCRAIEGCKLSAYHMGANASGTVFDGLATILRDSETVNRHLSTAARHQASSGVSPNVPAGLKRRLEEAQERGDANAQRDIRREIARATSGAPAVVASQGVGV